jgi:hypothetical protein
VLLDAIRHQRGLDEVRGIDDDDLRMGRRRDRAQRGGKH